MYEVKNLELFEEVLVPLVWTGDSDKCYCQVSMWSLCGDMSGIFLRTNIDKF